MGTAEFADVADRSSVNGRAFVAPPGEASQAPGMNSLRLGLLAFVGIGAGCIAAPNPMRTVDARVRAEPDVGQANTLVVMFPGLGDSPDDYVTHGFMEQLEAAGRNVDVIAVDARLGHYKRSKFLPRIRQDVFARPEVANYDEVWVVGISLGGLGAILTAREFEAQVDGVVLLSPYLGKPKRAGAIRAAGGLGAWQPPKSPSDDYTVELWRWLKKEASGGALFLAFGSEEDSVGHAVLRDALPEDRVTIAKGGHGWATWVQAWPALLTLGAVEELD